MVVIGRVSVMCMGMVGVDRRSKPREEDGGTGRLEPWRYGAVRTKDIGAKLKNIILSHCCRRRRHFTCQMEAGASSLWFAADADDATECERSAERSCMDARRVATGSCRCSDAGSTGAPMATVVVVVMEESPVPAPVPAASAGAPVLLSDRAINDDAPLGNRVRSEARCSTARTTNTPRYMAKWRTPLLPSSFFRSVFGAPDPDPDPAAEEVEEEEKDDGDDDDDDDDDDDAAAPSLSPPVAPGIRPP